MGDAKKVLSLPTLSIELEGEGWVDETGQLLAPRQVLVYALCYVVVGLATFMPLETDTKLCFW